MTMPFSPRVRMFLIVIVLAQLALMLPVRWLEAAAITLLR